MRTSAKNTLTAGVGLFVGLNLVACEGVESAEGEELLSSRSAVVYGSDDRTEVYAHPDATLVDLAQRSTAVMVSRNWIDRSDPEDVQLSGPTLQRFKNLCDGERFAEQPSVGSCSATLIAPDLVLTAGHCVHSAAACDRVSFVFHFYYENDGELSQITEDDVYDCSEVLTSRSEGANGDDFSIVRLDREVSGGQLPAPVNAATKLQNGSKLEVIGYPSGIPAKIDSNGLLQAQHEPYSFKATMDTFAGNSGSGVYDKDHQLVGVLVAGNADYVQSSEGCARVNYLNEGRVTSEVVVYFARALSALCDTGYEGELCGSGELQSAAGLQSGGSAGGKDNSLSDSAEALSGGCSDAGQTSGGAPLLLLGLLFFIRRARR